MIRNLTSSTNKLLLSNQFRFNVLSYHATSSVLKKKSKSKTNKQDNNISGSNDNGNSDSDIISLPDLAVYESKMHYHIKRLESELSKLRGK